VSAATPAGAVTTFVVVQPGSATSASARPVTSATMTFLFVRAIVILLHRTSMPDTAPSPVSLSGGTRRHARGFAGSRARRSVSGPRPAW